MLIDEVTSSGAGPALEATMRYAAQRQKLLAHAIANVNTPGFQPRDVPPSEFRAALQEAVDRRRGDTGGSWGTLDLPETEGLRRPDGGRGFTLVAHEPVAGVLQHDRTTRNVERLMQHLVENVASYRVAAELLRSRNDLVRTVLSDRS